MKLWPGSAWIPRRSTVTTPRCRAISKSPSKSPRGRADAGLTLRVAAEAFGLSFTTLREERYDLVIPRRETDSPAVKVLLEALSSSRLASEVSRLCLYDTSEMGKVAAEAG